MKSQFFDATGKRYKPLIAFEFGDCYKTTKESRVKTTLNVAVSSPGFSHVTSPVDAIYPSQLLNAGAKPKRLLILVEEVEP